MNGLRIPYQAALWTAPASFLFDFAAQQYGMFSTPNMLDIHKAHLSFFSPQPIFILLFFLPQQVCQLAWLWRLWRLNGQKSASDKREIEHIVDYVPFYALGNVCIGLWMFFWNASSLKMANFFVAVNTCAQLYYIMFRLRAMDMNSRSSILTHIVSKTFAGIGVLDILHNTSIAYFQDESASSAVRILTGVGFGLSCALSDWIFGGCLVYDLVALAVGQRVQYVADDSSWSNLLIIYAFACTAIVTLKNIFRPPYEHKQHLDYETLPTSSDEVS